MRIRGLGGAVAVTLVLLGACGDDADSDNDDEVAGTSGEDSDEADADSGNAGSESGGESDDGGSDGNDAPPTGPPADPPPASELEGVGVQATKIADVEKLTGIAWRDGDPDPYLADQHGQIYHLVDGSAEPVLDLTDQVLGYEPGAEYGMMGLVFDPVDGRLIVGYNEDDVTGPDTRVESYAVGDNGRPKPKSVREILTIAQPGVGHNSGAMVFDDQGNLLIGMGDGGGSKGADAQDMTKLLGGIVRITPNRDGPGYTVPDDNPYVGQDGVAPEIWAKGMRNPWRFSIDRPTGDIWVGDVGENDWESVYKIPAGESGVNFGWPTFEGSERIDFNAEVEPVSDPMMPVYVYHHETGPSVIGGYVYRGSAIPALQGAYVFMDMIGPVWAMGAEGADGVVQLDLEIGGVQTSFGEGPGGELYVLTQQNGAFKIEPA